MGLRLKKKYIILISIVLIIIIIRLLLPLILLNRINHTLAGIEDYDGHVEDIRSITLQRSLYNKGD